MPLEKEFNNCLNNIVDNLNYYQRDKKEYAIDIIAVQLRSLLYQSGDSQALFKQMKNVNNKFLKVKFPNTSEKSLYKFENFEIKLLDFTCGFFHATNFGVSGGKICSEKPTYANWEIYDIENTTFDKELKQWWEKEEILKIDQTAKYTRKDIVLFVANKSGGGHVDLNLSKESLYQLELCYNLKQFENVNFTRSVIHQLISTIALEVLFSLQKALIINNFQIKRTETKV